MAADGGTVQIDYRAKLDQLESDLATVKKKVAKSADDIGDEMDKRVAPKLERIRGAAVGVSSAFAGIKFSSAFSSKLQEAGDTARRFQDQVSGAASSTGLSMDVLSQKAKSFEFIPPTVAAEGIKTLSLLNQSMGLTGEASLDLSMKTLEVAQAMSVVAGVPVEQVLDGVAGAARGEYDAIQKLVPSLNGAAVEQRALADTGKTLAKELTEAEKSQAALNLILDEGNRYLPQLAANSDNAAAAQKRQAASSEEAKIAMGDKLLPIMEKVSDVTAKLFDGFSKLPDPVQNVVLGAVVLGGVLAPLGFALSSVVGALTALGIVGPTAAAGTAATGVAAGVATAPTAGFAAALWAVLWPVLAVVAALALIGLAVYLVIEHWDTIKNTTERVWNALPGPVQTGIRVIVAVMTGGFSEVVLLVIRNWDRIKSITITGVAAVVDTFLGMAELVTSLAAKAFGWVPGVGPKLRSAADAVANFRDDVNAYLAGIRDKNINVTTTYTDVYVTVQGGTRTYGGDSTAGIGQYAVGGLFTKPTFGLFAEAGPELLLPLTDMDRTRELLAQAGLLGESDLVSAGHHGDSYGGGGEASGSAGGGKAIQVGPFYGVRQDDLPTEIPRRLRGALHLWDR